MLKTCSYLSVRYREGLTHLQGLLCVRGETNYEDIIKRFGKDAGVALYLLGELNR